jgi:hypothetical protein
MQLNNLENLSLNFFCDKNIYIKVKPFYELLLKSIFCQKLSKREFGPLESTGDYFRANY